MTCSECLQPIPPEQIGEDGSPEVTVNDKPICKHCEQKYVELEAAAPLALDRSAPNTPPDRT
jgi:hypothetical protein